RRFSRSRSAAGKGLADRPRRWPRGAHAIRELRADHAVAPARQGPDGGAARALRRLTSLSQAPATRSFPPVVDERSLVLVLGTLPGEESLRRQEYYAHPRNLFWPIAGALFGDAPPARYPDRLGFV